MSDYNVTESFNSLWRKYYRPLYLYAYDILGDGEACRDVVNDVYANVWERMRDAVSQGSEMPQFPYSYLLVAVKNSCLSRLRHAAVEREYEEEYTQLRHDYYVEESQARKNDALVRQMLQLVPSPPTREILIECYLNRKTYKEVAEEMKISPDTVKKHIVKSLKLLRAAFNGKKMQDEIPDFDI